MVEAVRKRDGRIEPFEQEKITSAIYRAMFEAGAGNERAARAVSDAVVRALNRRFARRIPGVEDVQDAVERDLQKSHKSVAEAYGAYRRKKAEIRLLRKSLGIGTKLTVNAMTVLESRYLLKDDNGRIIETPAKMFRRVVRAVATADRRYGKSAEETKKTEQQFYDAMSRLEFMPNSPTLMNAGAKLGQLSACFVVPVEDSLESIFQAVKDTATIEQSGGGVGFSFSRLRPAGDIVHSTHGAASGPVSFMRVFDAATDVIKQGGKRRGAMIGVLRVDHPDIMEFITAKDGEKMPNFNISVAVTDSFMKAVRNGKKYGLVNPRTGAVVKRMDARCVWDRMAEAAWRTGDPGVIFIDEVNRRNPTPLAGTIESTNPCGELPLLPHESCNLGSINLQRMTKENNGKTEIDWKKLRNIVRTAIHFLDNAIDVNKFPTAESARATRANRKIGLGVMGFAEMLIMLGVPYDSKKALDVAEALMRFISREARKKSAELGQERGSFPNFGRSALSKKYAHMRNATTTAIAPTGTISIISGCSSGIEPLFALSFARNVLEGRRLLEMNRLFEGYTKKHGFYSAGMIMRIARKGSAKHMDGVPEEARKLFVTALDIGPAWHVRMQAAFQKYTDNGVSKTVNLGADATKSQVKRIFEMAHAMRCKGVTVYRYGSKKEQVLYTGGKEGFVSADAGYAGGCPTDLCPH